MGNKLVTTESFIKRAINTHGNKYEYDKTIYSGSKNLLIIKCKKHGYFGQLPHNHLKGKGCVKCRIEKSAEKYMYSQDKVIDKFKSVHGDRYDYSLVNYTGCKNKVTIICKIHGEFSQDAAAHTAGKGCDLCARQTLNYRKSDYIDLCKNKHNGKSNFYVLRMREDDGTIFYKIGITVQKLKYRYRSKDMPYDYEVVTLINADAESVFNTELEIKRIMLNSTYSPEKKFAGSRYECFSHIPDKVYEMIDSLVLSKNE
ncbi:endonuclease [Acinetobacter phage phiAC-1]|uniref:endonuclease n=1 Tax=Acinetobacter phage phiAC-1 TaxID=1229760 RepID=UPI00028AE4F4|nr:endonuclease [Acinetobacter phage phiAC-1]AFU62275.1 hypothetical protein phiAC-1_0026 [Acinetobacter phage phiAC-1]